MTAPLGPAQAYAEASRVIERECAQHLVGNDPSTFAYMLARAALLKVRDQAGSRRAAELCYGLGDEMTGGAE